MDFKKTDKKLYLPGIKPAVVEVPEMILIQVAGAGDPNTSSDYKTRWSYCTGFRIRSK